MTAPVCVLSGNTEREVTWCVKGHSVHLCFYTLLLHWFFGCSRIGFQSRHTDQMGANIPQRPLPKYAKVFKHSAVANGCRNIFTVTAFDPKMWIYPSRETSPLHFSMCACQGSIHEQPEQTSTPWKRKNRERGESRHPKREAVCRDEQK